MEWFSAIFGYLYVLCSKYCTISAEFKKDKIFEKKQYYTESQLDEIAPLIFMKHRHVSSNILHPFNLIIDFSITVITTMLDRQVQ